MGKVPGQQTLSENRVPGRAERRCRGTYAEDMQKYFEKMLAFSRECAIILSCEK